MNTEPRHSADYSHRQIEAARRVLVDIGQVLASFEDCMVVIGGWAPDLLLPDAEEPHVGSIDVDLALDAAKLNQGQYAELVKLLLDTRRYRHGDKDYQLVVDVDLADGAPPVQVEVEFLAPKEVKLKKHRPKLVQGFRVIRADGCSAAFHAPVEHSLTGLNVRGARNTVRLWVTSLADLIVMKAWAIGGRDKPKDTYDLCYCLDNASDGVDAIARELKPRLSDSVVAHALEILREKFADMNAFGPQQLVEFHDPPEGDEKQRLARRAFELVQRFLSLVDAA